MGTDKLVFIMPTLSKCSFRLLWVLSY